MIHSYFDPTVPAAAIAIGTITNFYRMAHWLVKSEPSAYSWDQLVKEKRTVWSGVRNYAARLHLANMKKGDEILFLS
jgi:hypothetical protein